MYRLSDNLCRPALINGCFALSVLLLSACGGSDPAVPVPEATQAEISLLEDGTKDGMLTGKAFGGRASRFVLQSPPMHGSVTIEPSGAYVYRPAANFHGSDQFEFVVGDGQQSSPAATVDVTVEAVNDVPIIEPMPDFVPDIAADVYEVALSVTDADGETVSVTAAGSDDGRLRVSLDDTQNVLRLTPLGVGETQVTLNAADSTSQAQPVTFTARFDGSVLATTVSVEDEPDSYAMKLVNSGAATAYFSLNMNGDLFFRSLDDVLQTALGQDEQTTGEQDHRKIWRFLYDNHYHHWSLTGAVWQHDPVLFLNSIGVGMCDDLSSMTYHLARAAGYESRVWTVIGHVVPEVKVDGRWEAWDANMGVYYKNADRTVAGVEQLAATPSLVSDPVDPVRPLDDDNDAYHPIVADHYGTADNNFVSDYYTSPLKEYNREFMLPPGATLEFPGIWDEPPLALEDRLLPIYANMKIELPAGWTGRFSAPLLLSRISGTGRITLNGQPYDIGDPELHADIHGREAFAHEIDVLESTSELTLIYLVHPGRARLNQSNDVEVSGLNVDDLSVEATPLTVDQRLPYTLPIEHQPW